MKRILFLLLVFAGMLIYTACEKTGMTPIEETPEFTQEFTVPDIPPEIEALMRPEDIARFKAGPGEEHLNAVQARSLYGHSKGNARWHPIMFSIGYDLLFVPIGGTGCAEGEFYLCPYADNPMECFQNSIGFTGETWGQTKWLGSDISSYYVPVFCAISEFSWEGYGQGYYEALDDKLDGENKLYYDGDHDPTYFDADGNLIFTWEATFDSELSTGIFEGAFGWENAVIITTPENQPSSNPNGEGYSDSVHFGWVFF